MNESNVWYNNIYNSQKLLLADENLRKCVSGGRWKRCSKGH